MENQNENKRLVLIGIRKKGEKGFKTLVDSKATLNQIVTDEYHTNIPITPISNSDRIINLLGD
jgi:hypothetical protein